VNLAEDLPARFTRDGSNTDWRPLEVYGMKPEECSALVLLSNTDSECFLHFRLVVQALQIGSGTHSKIF
jgi:hypothetical protein